MLDLRYELTKLLNYHDAEHVSNTPDYVLAQFLLSCLAAFDQATQQRENFYGRDPRPTEPPRTKEIQHA